MNLTQDQSKVREPFKSMTNLHEHVLLEARDDLEGCGVESDDVDEVVVAERRKELVDGEFRDRVAHPLHWAWAVEEDDHLLGTGGRLDEPSRLATVVHVILLLPLWSWGQNGVC